MKTLVVSGLQPVGDDLARIRETGAELLFHDNEHQMPERPEEVEAAIVNSLFYYQDIRRFPRLRYIQTLSVGLDRVPLAYCREHGIEVHNAGGAYCVPMAEWTVMSLLELLKYAPTMQERRAQGIWKRDYRWKELDGRRALIVGVGDYGREVAKRLSAFGVHTVGLNRTPRTNPWLEEFYPLERLDEQLPLADIVILGLALSPETTRILNRERISRLKPSCLIVNCARGQLADQAALTEALEKRYIAGAALDVFEQEPLPQDDPLWKLENVLITPHCSFIGNRNHERIMDIVVGNLQAYMGPRL